MKMNRHSLSLKTGAIRLFLHFLLFLGAWPIQAQQAAYDRQFFRDLSGRLSEEYRARRQEAQAFALERNLLLTEPFDGGFLVLESVEDGRLPVYRKLYNLGTARSLNTDFLRPRSALSLNLLGQGMTVGIWDGDNFKENHIEFGNRVKTRGSISDEPLGLGGDHSTHVSGTIAAAGVNADARGMAPQTQAFVYDFLNDQAEIASELAAEEPMILSNHSYGLVLGWQPTQSGWRWVGDPSISNTEDYRFGFYDSNNSRALDDIAFNAPFYLHVRAAGNDRSDVGDGSRPPDGPYDCIGPEGIAKNVLTVGAVQKLPNRYTRPEDVVMSEFSSWGPTDDGRIKPDIAAPGVDVLSTYAAGNNQYGLLSGTSMAAPAVTGSLALLQQHWRNTSGGNYMRAATLKALIIHTAREAGRNPGPDYEFGWGLLASDLAASLITRRDGSNFIIDERILVQNDSIVYTVQSDGTQPLVASISWTDPAGTAATPSLNPTTPRLVNDLDLRIYDAQGNRSLPWILDPSRPDRGATNGDNTRDNVEKVEIPAPAAGAYRVVVRHKGLLRNGRQDVSIVISSRSPEQNLQTYFWIGGSGNWNDGSRWSNRSGGPAINAVPGLANPVVFDQNSFAGNINTINFPANASCYNLTYAASQGCTFVLGGNTLTIDGSVEIENDLVAFSGGTVIFSGTVSKMNYVKAGANTFANTNLTLNSVNGSWNFQTDLNTRNLSITQSSFILRNRNLRADNFNAGNISGQQIAISGASVSGLATFTLSANAAADFSNTTFRYEQGVPGNPVFSGGGKNFYNISASGVNLTINGDNRFNSLDINGSLRLNGSNRADSLRLSSASTLILAGGTSQTLVRAFDAKGTAGRLLPIRSDGPGNAFLFADNPNIRFCLDYLDITGVSVSGQTAFLTGDNSRLDAASEGWIELDCRDALFPDFEVRFPCAMGETQFVDASTGGPVSWGWDFGNFQFPAENNSTLQNPVHQFRFPGEYTITLNVKNNLFDQTITRPVAIETSRNNLTVPSINIDGERLTASVVAQVYEWYRNGQRIAGADERVFRVSQAGVYTVVVADDQCRFRSRATAVTSLEELVDGSGALRLYPNPASGYLSIELASSERGAVELGVSSLLGQMLISQRLDKSDDSLSHKLDVGMLSPGAYILTLRTAEHKYRLRFVVR
jgi:subtilisin family serine protease